VRTTYNTLTRRHEDGGDRYPGSGGRGLRPRLGRAGVQSQNTPKGLTRHT